MDANGQRFWMLADGRQFDLTDGRAAWDYSRRVLRLASRRRADLLPADRVLARALANGPASTIDPFGTWASVTDDLSRVVAAGAFSDSVPIYAAPGNDSVLDMTMGEDDVLYLAVGTRGEAASIVLLDRRDRWDPVTLAVENFAPDALAAAADGGVWALDRGRGRVARVRGLPQRRHPFSAAAPGTFRPCAENPDPPQLYMLDDMAFPTGLELIAMAAAPDGRVVMLAWPAAPTSPAELHQFDGRRLLPGVPLAGSLAPYSIGWVERNRWAVIFSLADAEVREAICYELPELPAGEAPPYSYPAAQPLGDRYPVDVRRARRFCNAPTSPVYYLGERDGETLPLPLFRLSMPSLATSASVPAFDEFDSGSHGTVWHRIYLEAALPAGTGVKVVLTTADDKAGLEGADEAVHLFGNVPTAAGGCVDLPQGAWLPYASELPYHRGLLPCPPERDRAGLFTLLVQRPGRRVRTLRGRYLRVTLELFGTGHATPEIAALRVYAPRFSYLDRYLPEHYRETVFGGSADKSAAATGADFLQRFLCLFEGVLTPLEDRVANAYLVTMPETAPTEALPWLAEWIGLTLEPGLPEVRQRLLLREATRIYRRRGTLSGLQLALDIATGGMVSRQEIVVLEDFRLRRTFATILGADLANEDDPLLSGIVESGNSFVGDTLFLGDEQQQEFLALFAPGAERTVQERQAVAELFEKLAFRVTILVHRGTADDELRLVKRIVALETPAHVEVRILAASKGLIVGLAALIGIDTAPGMKEPARPVRVENSVIGWRDYILGIGSLDPRLQGAGSGTSDARAPQAHADDVAAGFGDSVTLDASGSRAFGNRRLVRFDWKV